MPYISKCQILVVLKNAFSSQLQEHALIEMKMKEITDVRHHSIAIYAYEVGQGGQAKKKGSNFYF